VEVDLVGIGAASISRGDGSLAAPRVWTLPVGAEGLALGDLDGDGTQDLVTAFPSRESLACRCSFGLGQRAAENDPRPCMRARSPLLGHGGDQAPE
jgi:hypothetical protein